MSHVRNKTVRPDRRIAALMRDRPKVETLCGAPISANDITIADARKSLQRNDWPVCPACAAVLQKRSQPGTYVTDKSDSGRYYRAIYRVTKEIGDRSICLHVGDIINGRVEWTRQKTETHRTTANLVEYTI